VSLRAVRDNVLVLLLGSGFSACDGQQWGWWVLPSGYPVERIGVLDRFSSFYCSTHMSVVIRGGGLLS